MTEATSDSPTRPGSAAGLTLLLTALVAGSAWRLADVGPALLFGDELHSLGDIHGGLRDALSTFSDTGSGMALPLLQLALIEAFGTGPWAIRAPAWLPALATLYLVYPIARRRLGRPAAVAATLLVAVNPLLIFYAHFARAYALVVLLSLLLLDRLERIVDGTGDGVRPPLAALVVLTSLLPWVHPTALGFVLPVYAGAIFALAARPAGGRRALWLLAALAAAGVGCLLLHLPAWDSLLAFVSEKTTAEYYGEFGLLDVAALAAGSRPGAVLFLLAAVLAALAWPRERGARGLPLIFAAAGPGLMIALVQPYGDAYAYARYVMPSIVPLCMLLGASAASLAERLFPAAPYRASLAPAIGAAAAGLLLFGRGAPGMPGGGPHANTYLELFPLPAFDRPWADTPQFYRDLARRPSHERRALRLIEAPALTNRTRHLYRNYQLQHGAQTLLAPLPREFPMIPAGPYVSLRSKGWRAAADADFLVLHLDVADEVVRYWSSIYSESAEPVDDEAGAAYLERHGRFGGTLPAIPRGWLTRLESQLGAPFYRDADIVVWRLRDEPRS